jgi:WD40 repeat protein
VTRVDHDGVVWSVAYSCNGRIATAGADSTARVWGV